MGRRLAEPLLYLLSLERLRLKAWIKDYKYYTPSTDVSDNIALSVVVYGPAEKGLRDLVGNLLRQRNIWLQQVSPGLLESNTSYNNPHYPAQTRASNSLYSTGVDTETRSADFLKRQINEVFEKMGNVEDLAEMEPPPALTASLYKHQKQALCWMNAHERGEDSGDAVSIWQEKKTLDGRTMWVNILTNLKVTKKPPSLIGGILADDMGLGKTITTLALLCFTKEKALAYSKHRRAHNSLRRVKTTLIVTPLTTLDNWEDQLQSHVLPGELTSLRYHGGKRESEAMNLPQYDVVLTTYQILGLEYAAHKKWQEQQDPTSKPSPLFQTGFFRVVLDEAHIIKDPSTKQSQGACGVSAYARWCLTGTPIQNRIEDLGALYKFLRLPSFEDKGHGLRFLRTASLTSVQTLVKATTLRRTKDSKFHGQPILNLPPKTEYVKTLTFDASETVYYNNIRDATKQILDNTLNSKQKTGAAYLNILQLILKMRQTCVYGKLETATNAETTDTWTLMRESGQVTLVGYMAHESHVFCLDCISRYRTAARSAVEGAEYCPICNASMNLDMVEIRNTPDDVKDKDSSQARAIADSPRAFSTKMQALFNDLIELRDSQDDVPLKGIVFSQWTGALDMVEQPIRDQIGLGVARLDGSMKPADRRTAIQDFRLNSECQILLISLKAGGVGLNLTSATHAIKVFILEPCFNPASESQAIDRAYRIGQEQPVTVTHYIMKDSVEEAMLELQKKKTKMASELLSHKLSKKDEEKERLSDLKLLLTTKPA
ncbi:hypothetical protein YB2330_000419 [Saitoella coloradoensis]